MAINKNFVIPDVGIEATGASVFSNNVTIAGNTAANNVTVSGTLAANINANTITTGTVNPARLGTGTANTSTFLRGDGSWTIASITLSSNNTSANTFYLPMSANASGSWTSGVVSDTTLSYIPSTGTLRATSFVGNAATINAISINTVSANVNVSNNFLVAPAFRAYSEFISANTTTTGATSLDLSSSNFFNLTLTGNTTFSFTNAPSGRMFSFTIVARQDATGGRTITWPTGSRYAGGLVPPATTTANAIDIWSAMTYDGGTTYIISLSVKDAK